MKSYLKAKHERSRASPLRNSARCNKRAQLGMHFSVKNCEKARIGGIVTSSVNDIGSWFQAHVRFPPQ
jgi:hypothetical protein